MAKELYNSIANHSPTTIVYETVFANSPPSSSTLVNPLEAGSGNHQNFDKKKEEITLENNEVTPNKPIDLSENSTDHLSEFSDDYLALILNHLPTTDAVKTLNLRCFGNLWTSSLKSLIFDSRDKWFSGDKKNRRFTDFVTGVVNRYQSTQIHKFELKFCSMLYFKNDEEDSATFPMNMIFLKQMTAETVDSWIEWAVKKNVKILDIGILVRNSSADIKFNYDFPIEDVHSNYLEELWLSNVSIGVRGEWTKVHLENLKSMFLAGVTFGHWSMISGIVDGCPNMEQLELVECKGIGINQIRCCSKNLKAMKVNLGKIMLPRPMQISAPDLVSLHLEGQIGSFKLKHVSSLQELTLKFVDGRASMPNRGQFRSHYKLLKTLENIRATTSGCSISFFN